MEKGKGGAQDGMKTRQDRRNEMRLINWKKKRRQMIRGGRGRELSTDNKHNSACFKASRASTYSQTCLLFSWPPHHSSLHFDNCNYTMPSCDARSPFGWVRPCLISLIQIKHRVRMRVDWWRGVVLKSMLNAHAHVCPPVIVIVAVVTIMTWFFLLRTMCVRLMKVPPGVCNTVYIRLPARWLPLKEFYGVW